ncbi:ComF family protein [Asaia sp. VD9]|uniref:ComF family protein n=1 Tax=Asaia sp. VD9 TaxID=3081235 RepID=UPI00301A8883
MTPFRKLARAGLDFLFPPICLACSAETGSSGLVCAACFTGLSHLTGACTRCALPLPAPDYADSRGYCPTCAQSPPLWHAARAAFQYEGTARRLVLQLKYADRLDITPFLTRAMQQGGADILAEAECLVPVPLHRHRFWHRRFNQAAILARVLSRLAPQARLVPDALIRIRATKTLARLDPGERRRALEDAFVLRPAARIRVAGRHVVLVDDILTTGATASICASRLLQAGARRVDLLVAARAVKHVASDPGGDIIDAEE